MRMRRLFSQRDAHRWAWDRVLPCVTPADAARLAVAALESRCRDLAPLAQWLFYGDAPFALLAPQHALHEAARAGCWVAGAFFLHKLIPLTDLDALEADPSWRRPKASPIERAIALHKWTHHRFPVAVLEAAATRGDFLAVQWLLEATDVDGPSDEDAQSSFALPVDLKHVAIQAAARARQLEMVDWLVAYAHDMTCVVPYDKALGIICWSRVEASQRSLPCTMVYAATAKYGYHPPGGIDGPMTTSLAGQVPLGDVFASHGDLEELQRLERYSVVHPELPKLISASAMEHAAAGGHLQVLQWLYERAPTHLDGIVAMTAAEYGRLDVLEWISHAVELAAVAEGYACAAARNGHLDVLRWLQARDLLAWGNLDYKTPMGFAIRGGHFEVVQFLHKECAMAITASIEHELSRCPDVRTMEYVLDAWTGLPPRYSTLLADAAWSASAEMVSYLVLKRGCWSRDVLARVVHRREECLDISQFLVSHANVRAKRRGTPLNTELAFSSVTILGCVQRRWFETALWLAKCVPSVRMGVLSRHGDSELLTANALAQEPGAQRVLLACITCRASECSQLEWLPEWAIRANCYESFQALLQMQHPCLSADGAYHRIIPYSRDRRFMLLAFQFASAQPVIGQVITWAAKIGSVVVLEAAMALVPDTKCAKYLHFVNSQAVERGYVDVLEWCTTQAHVDEAKRAVRQGHVEVLEWYHSRHQLPTDPKSVEAIALVAATSDQLGCLRWLLETLDIRANSLRTIQRELVRMQFTEAARVISRHSPKKPFSSKHKRSR